MSGSILNPSLENNLNLVAKVFHRHILHSAGPLHNDQNEDLQTKFDIDNFIPKKYSVAMVVLPMQYGGMFSVQKRKLLKCCVPKVADIRAFLWLIFSKIRLNVQCAIVSLLYCERLMKLTNIAITKRNWRPILLVCLLESSKMWDDISSWNVEFSQLFPCFGRSEINHLEKMFLHEMSYDLFVSGVMYAKYYYALRGLRYTNDNEVPKNYLDIQLKKKAKIHQGMGSKNPLQVEICLQTRSSRDDEEEILDNKEPFPKARLVGRSPLNRFGEAGYNLAKRKGYNRGKSFSITRTDININGMPKITEGNEDCA